jgi:hypothetical protein
MSDQEDDDLGGIPSLLKMNQLQGVYKNLKEQDADGNLVELKMHATAEFRSKLNNLVHDLVLNCVAHARRQGRMKLIAEDVPQIEDPDLE